MSVHVGCRVFVMTSEHSRNFTNNLGVRVGLRFYTYFNRNKLLYVILGTSQVKPDYPK